MWYTLPEFVLGLPLGGGTNTNFANFANHETPSIVCHVEFFIHVKFFGPVGLHLLV